MNPTNRYDELVNQGHRRTDEVFFWLLLGQWALAIVLAVLVSPHTWAGRTPSLHSHVLLAVLLGGALNSLPLVLIRLRPGWWLTRHTVATAQMMWSALLIHLTGGRIETHFHVFGSLAFVAFYRDWKVLVTATVVVASDHLFRGLAYPESVYGIANPEWWRFLEHAGWVVFEDIVLVLACHRELTTNRAVAEREAELTALNQQFEDRVHRRTFQLEQSMRRFQSLIEGVNVVPFEIDAGTGQFTYIAPQGASFYRCTPAELARLEFLMSLVVERDRERTSSSLRAALQHGGSGTIDYRVRRPDGSELEVRTIYRFDAVERLIRGVSIDVTETKRLESELGQAQKLESVGRLASGVAHEINTPVQFVSDSVHFLKDASTDLLRVVADLHDVRERARAGAVAPERLSASTDLEAEVDVAYLTEAVPRAIERSLDGLSRVATIVRSMKEFAHPDSSEKMLVDLNRAIESTLVIANNELKYVADVEKDFGELPQVACHVGEVNQVVLNLVVNAAHAIGDVVKNTGKKGRITVSTRVVGAVVEVSVADTGGGIPEAVRPKIFEPFFTTKGVGKGTGQGLAIARSVAAKHEGSLSFTTELGRGTCFTLKLPLDHAPVLVAA
ncbi:MAG: PAS domain-containing protein [Archangium sp.]|nr:PAS domain-containing protein [Archangium sp.]